MTVNVKVIPGVGEMPGLNLEELDLENRIIDLKHQLRFGIAESLTIVIMSNIISNKTYKIQGFFIF